MKGAVTALRGLMPANSFNPHNNPRSWAALCQLLHVTIAPHGPCWVWASAAGGCGQLEGGQCGKGKHRFQIPESLLGSIILGKLCNVSASIPYIHTGNNGTCPLCCKDKMG